LRHYSSEERNAVRAMLRRAAVVSSDDSGPQQLLSLSGFSQDLPRQVVRVQEFGFSSNPPVGGEGLILCPGGRSDRAMFWGGAHAQYRPTNLPVGATALYDAFGQILEFVQNSVKLVCTATFEIDAPNVLIKGALTVTETFDVQNTGAVSAPANITGTIAVTGDVTAGAISLQNHVHGGVETGPGETGAATG
jgi:phage baseplate assembly protein V